MKWLELKLPPVLVFILTAVLMWLITLCTVELGLHKSIRFIVGAVSLAIGGGIAISGVLGFRNAKTTVDPIQPDKASSLVCSGIYRFTRNPMYTGLVFVLFSWGLFWDNLFSMLFLGVFPLYINRFQIKPEERALESLFGDQYRTYKKRVRRWL